MTRPDPVREPPRPHRVRVRGDLFHGRVPDGAVYVGRGSPGLPASRWANRHRVGTCRRCGGIRHDHAAAVEAYARDLAARPDLVAAARRELAGSDLACWCRLDVHPCHAELLLAIAAGAEPLDAYAELSRAARDRPR